MTIYIGEIRMFAGNFQPNGWLFCAGQTLPIAEHDVLFTIIGTTYGGDGEQTFRLPDLRGRLPVHWGGSQYPQPGIAAGTEEVTLTPSQIPNHTHTLLGTTNTATSNSVEGNIPATMLAAGTNSAYDNTDPPRALAGDTIAPLGGSQPHSNLQPYLCLNFIISLYGEFPIQS